MCQRAAGASQTCLSRSNRCRAGARCGGSFSAGLAADRPLRVCSAAYLLSFQNLLMNSNDIVSNALGVRGLWALLRLVLAGAIGAEWGGVLALSSVLLALFIQPNLPFVRAIIAATLEQVDSHVHHSAVLCDVKRWLCIFYHIAYIYSPVLCK